MTYTETIEMESGNTVCFDITRDEVAKLFADASKTPRNDALEEDDSFTAGEVQYIFSKDNTELEEILIYPTYSYDDGGIINGDFINAPDSFWEKEAEVREKL